MLVAPSLLSADFSRLGEEVAALEQAGADWVHFDVMDGHFVPPITIGPRTVEHCRRYAKLPFDVHLMIENPERTIEAFRDAGATMLSVHVEATRHIHRVLDTIRQAGLRPGGHHQSGVRPPMLARSRSNRSARAPRHDIGRRGQHAGTRA